MFTLHAMSMSAIIGFMGRVAGLVCLLLYSGCGLSKEERIASEQRELEAKKNLAVEGEVFIRAQDASIHPLALVEVAIYEPEALEAHLAIRFADEKRIRSEISKTVSGAEKAVILCGELLDAKKKELAHAKAMLDIISLGTRDKPKKEFLDTIATMGEIVAQLEKSFSELNADLTKRRTDLELWPSSSYYFHKLPKPTASTITDSAGKFTFVLKNGKPVYIVAKSDRHVGTELEHYYWMVRLVPSSATHSKIILANHNLGSSVSDDSIVKAKKEQLYTSLDEIEKSKKIQSGAAIETTSATDSPPEITTK